MGRPERAANDDPKPLSLRSKILLINVLCRAAPDASGLAPTVQRGRAWRNSNCRLLMAKTRSKTDAQDLTDRLQFAQFQLTNAERNLEATRESSRLAKRRRKEAKQAARRARKGVKRAKVEVAEAIKALARVEAELAETGSRRVRKEARSHRASAKARNQPLTAKKTVPRAARKKTERAEERVPPVPAAMPQPRAPISKPQSALEVGITT